MSVNPQGATWSLSSKTRKDDVSKGVTRVVAEASDGHRGPRSRCAWPAAEMQRTTLWTYREDMCPAWR
jgi:hypothetical protein